MSDMIDTTKELLDYADLEHMTGVGRRSLQRWTREGTFPHPVLLGRGAISRFRRTDVLKWLAELPNKAGAAA